MAYVRIESTVPRHPKFLAAGPAACWLWVCGTAYVQDHLTDGFIPAAVVAHLGVANPRKSIDALVSSGLWEAVDGGWQIHDYLQHNMSREAVEAIRADKRAAGKRGGDTKAANLAHSLARAREPATPAVYPSNSLQLTANSLQLPATPPDSPLVVGDRPDEDPHTELRTFQAAYPGKGRIGGYRLETAWFEARRHASLAVMLAALENHTRSAQWRSGKVPNMDRWLSEQHWLRELPAEDAQTGATLPAWTRGMA